MQCLAQRVVSIVTMGVIVFLAGCTSTWPIQTKSRPAAAQLLPNAEQRVSGDYRNFGPYNCHLWPTLTGRQVPGERVRLSINPSSKKISASLFSDGKLRDQWSAHYRDKGTYLRVFLQSRLYHSKIPVSYGYEAVSILIGRSQEHLIVNMGSSITALFIVMPWVGGAETTEIAYEQWLY